MLFDVGWPELMLIGAVALVVVGPKDLPRALRVAGIWMRKARNMSREFQNSVEQMIRDSELDDIRRDFQQATEFDFEHHIQNTIDPTGELDETVKSLAAPDYFEPALPTLEAPVGAVPRSEEATEAALAPPPDPLEEPELPLLLPEPPHPEPPKP